MEHNPFLQGFLEVITTELGVQIVDDDGQSLYNDAILRAYPNATLSTGNATDLLSDINATTTTVVVQEFDLSGGYILSHAQELNRLLRQHYFNSNTSVRSNIYAKSSDGVPRIGILNRQPSNGRFIHNAEMLRDSLEKALFSNETSSSASPSIPIVFFEGRTFLEQVDFFQNTDIVLSPHGAQLTGVPFLANKPCSHVVELFPKRYWIPSFFGSLARNAGVQYSALYLSNHPPEGELAETLRERVRVRAQWLCPDPNEMVAVIQELVSDWEQCQRQLQV